MIAPFPQVSELESIFNMLDADVNGLLMTGPPVALDELYHAEGQAQAALSDQSLSAPGMQADAVGSSRPCLMARFVFLRVQLLQRVANNFAAHQNVNQ